MKRPRQICNHLYPAPSPEDRPYARMCPGCKRYVSWGGDNIYTRQPGWVIEPNPVFKPRKPIKPGVVLP